MPPLLPALLGALTAACGAGACATPASTSGAPATQEAPGLVVLVVVDQLSADVLERYADLFEGGLKRLLEHGRVWTNATHDHAITETAPGHATLSTGTHPSRHGVVANQWWEPEEGGWRTVFNVLDTATRLSDAPTFYGSSPRVLRREALGDWLVRAHPESRVVSLSPKDRGAVLLAGQGRHRVFWLDVDLARWVTSTYYADSLPAWVSAFNERTLPTLHDSVWSSAVPPALAARSRPDTAAWEHDGVHTAFPHRWADEHAADSTLAWEHWWTGIPTPDRATLLLAREAVVAEELGTDGAPDLLAVSLSQTDRIGHPFGPWSREQLDNLLRLDAELGAFFEWLDERLGAEGYVVALTADHGVMPTPEALVERGVAARRLGTEARDSLQRALDAAFGWARKVGSEQALRDTLVARARALDWIADAWDEPRLLAGETPDSFAVMQARSSHPGRATGLLGRLGVVYRMEPDVLSWSLPRGTTHGSPYLYDRRVPFVLMGPEIEAGRVPERVGTTDLAPTLARILGIPVPDDLDGLPRAVR